ncbi:hypothetical protein KAR91_61225 [Candidatus Pacearchaeota archaeon]|nr:hypothetical protein [Candidatus Pacearchaeota archaeon]
MTYYWIRKEDLQDQEVIDEAEIDSKVCFVKVTQTRGAIAYHEETMPEPQESKDSMAVTTA